jgi:hypothetical protein
MDGARADMDFSATSSAGTSLDLPERLDALIPVKAAEFLQTLETFEGKTPR